MEKNQQVYELFGISSNCIFDSYLKQLQNEELVCDTCYLPHKSPNLLINYYFVQNIQILEGSNLIIRRISGINNNSGIGNVIDIDYDNNLNPIIFAFITKPIVAKSDINTCDYYEVFWCGCEGVFVCECPIIIVNFRILGRNYKLKGRVLCFKIENGRAIYRIKITSCNCFYSEFTSGNIDSINLQILPKPKANKQKEVASASTI